MGSHPDSAPLADASSSTLVLARATEEERRRTWSLTHPLWGPALSLDDYLTREAYMTTVPLAKNGGITHWVLTDASLPPNERPILSSCETTRKPAVSSKPSGDGKGEVVLVDGVAHAIGSVFTDAKYRGKGYASRMMADLARRVRNWQVSDNDDNPEPSEDGPGTLFSVLYSDIGKSFYAKHGWEPFTSTHVELPPVPGASSGLEPHHGYARRGPNGSSPPSAKPIGYHELAELCSVDERMLRAKMAQRTEETGKTCVAIVPSLDSILWHLMREDFMTKHIFGRTPGVKGAVFGEPGKRLWAVWMRGYYGGLERRDGNTLYVLRFVMEDESAGEEYLGQGVRSILQIAQAEAAEWQVQDVQIWNPTDLLKTLVEKSGLEPQFVTREKDSIASLRWHGEGSLDLEWVLNEKYAWC